MDLVYPLPVQNGTCGYCKGRRREDVNNRVEEEEEEERNNGSIDDSLGTFVTESAWAVVMQPQTYRSLIDANWRRSGCYLYRPILDRICCRPYAIRVNMGEVQLSRSQGKTLRRFWRWAHQQSPRSSSSSSDFISTSTSLEWIWKEMNNNIDSSLSWRLVRAVAHSTSSDEYNLYQRYQQSIHRDQPEDLSIESFKRFLCDNPFDGDGNDQETWDITDTLPFGSYHLQWLYRRRQKSTDGDDDEVADQPSLVAVSVIDILPGCLSSVYFFYDPDLSHLSLGTVSACLEMALAWRWLGEKDDAFYYLGYYIDDCPKMRYKAKFGPCQILAPEEHCKWITFEEAAQRYQWQKVSSN